MVFPQQQNQLDSRHLLYKVYCIRDQRNLRLTTYSHYLITNFYAALQVECSEGRRRKFETMYNIGIRVGKIKRLSSHHDKGTQVARSHLSIKYFLDRCMSHKD